MSIIVSQLSVLVVSATTGLRLSTSLGLATGGFGVGWLLGRFRLRDRFLDWLGLGLRFLFRARIRIGFCCRLGIGFDRGLRLLSWF